MQIKELGHVVLFVSNLAQSVHFYESILGFPKIAYVPPMAVFSSGRTHHELLLIEVGGKAEKRGKPKPGLYHIGFKVGDDDETLRQVVQELEQHHVPLVGTADHGVTHSVYILDPDGNELELYVDASDDWKENPLQILSKPKALHL